jgi:hypothetical protein
VTALRVRSFVPSLLQPVHLVSLSGEPPPHAPSPCQTSSPLYLSLARCFPSSLLSAGRAGPPIESSGAEQSAQADRGGRGCCDRKSFGCVGLSRFVAACIASRISCPPALSLTFIYRPDQPPREIPTIDSFVLQKSLTKRSRRLRLNRRPLRYSSNSSSVR